MKVHSDTECVAVDVRVARLETANQGMRAALRELRDLLPEYTEETEEGVRLNIAATIDAALTDDGAGWVEARERMQEGLKQLGAVLRMAQALSKTMQGDLPELVEQAAYGVEELTALGGK